MVDLNNVEYRSVVLAAFLHDIGKLLGRFTSELLDKAQHPAFSSQFVSSHNQFFENFCDSALLKELVQKHHESSFFPVELRVQGITDPHTRSLAKLVSLADNLSSSERGDASTEYSAYKKVPLCSVIDRLYKDPAREDILRFRPMPLPSTTDEKMQKCIFPEAFTAYQPGELNRHIEDFGKEFEQYTKSVSETAAFQAFLTHIDNLVYKYTWCIPSNTQEELPDVSLYDHLKVSAAIAACLYQYHAAHNSLDEKAISSKVPGRFLIAAGDISGIQNYIFDITSAGGIAKKLRARSMIVQSCSEIATHKILHRLGLPFWNNIMSAGGNFYLLLPDLPDVQGTLGAIQEEIDNWFLKEMNGELALNLAWQSFGNEGFKPTDTKDDKSGFSNIIYEVKDKLNARKQHRFSTVLADSHGWKEDGFVIEQSFDGKGICKSCFKFPGSIAVEEDRVICSDCDKQKNMGSRLPDTEYLACFDITEGTDYTIAGYGISASSTPRFASPPYLVTRLNNPDISAVPNLPASFKYLASYVPKHNNEIKTFEDMAHQPEGQPLLGFLKADVDNLGQAFILGFKRDGKSIDTISRQATFSRLLDTFFSGWIEHLVSTRYKDCYTVFSGGDDLFYVGPWKQILELATQVNADFACFANDKLTLSAGVFIARADYPMAMAAQEVNKALEKSKKGDNTGQKNRITILNETMTWSEWEQVKAEWGKILPSLGNAQQTKSALLYNLLEFAEMWRKYLRGNTRGLRYHPLLTYNIARNISPRNEPEIHNWTSGLLKWPPDEKQRLLLKYLGLIATLCLYNRRGGKNDSAI